MNELIRLSSPMHAEHESMTNVPNVPIGNPENFKNRVRELRLSPPSLSSRHWQRRPSIDISASKFNRNKLQLLDMATVCQAVPASGLFAPSSRRPNTGASQLIAQGGSSRISRTSPQRDCVTCCSSNDSHSLDTKKSSERPTENVTTWWEEVNTAAIGVILGVGIGASCLALPAYANFLSFDHADLRGANMSGENLAGVVFAACDCRKINLEGTVMDGSTDTFAGFEGGNLKNSSWIRAFADRVVFRGANLQNANFTDAVLSGSQFDGADITGADFTDALVDNYQRLQMCRRAKGTNPTTGVATRESLFC